MALDLEHLPTEVANALRRYARARLALAWLSTAAGAIATLLAAAWAAMLLDLALFLSPGTRFGLSMGVLCLGAIVFLAGALSIAFRRVDARRVAYDLEAAAGGDADEPLITAAQVLPHDSANGDVHAALAG